MKREIEAAERFRDSFLETLAERIDRYTGLAYRAGRGAETPENHSFEWLSLVRATIVAANPKFRCRSMKPASQGDTARAMAHALNAWSDSIGYGQQLVRTFDDFAFCYGASIVLQAQPPGYSRDPSGLHYPCRKRIPQNRIIWDPLAATFDEARYVGHASIVDKDTLESRAQQFPEEGWITTAIASLTADTQSREIKKGRDFKDAPDRKEIVYYELWVPEYRLPGVDMLIKPDGSVLETHGTIFTVGCSQSGAEGVYLREPRPYYGPRWGPYNLFGAYPVIDCPFPLSPLTAVDGQSINLNAQAQAIDRGMSSYKRLVVTGSKDTQKKLVNAPHDHVVLIPGLRKDDTFDIEQGGVTAAMVSMFEIAKDRLNRSSGMSDAMKGNVDPNTTATADAIASSGSTARLAFLRRQFESSVVQEAKTAGWHMYHDDRFVMALGEEAAAEFGMVNPVFLGGWNTLSNGADFDDLLLEMEPYSMGRMDEAQMQQNTLAFADWLINAAPVMTQTPFLPWSDMIRQFGEVMNLPNIAAKVNIPLMQQIGQAQMLAAMAPDPAQAGGHSSGSGGGGGLPGRRSGQRARKGAAA